VADQIIERKGALFIDQRIVVDQFATTNAGESLEMSLDAAITACVRLSTSSLKRIAETWAFTVASEIDSS
jgi:hypothetical protein